MNLKLALLSFCLLLIIVKSHGQRIDRESYKVVGEKHFYYVMRPEGSIKGILLLFPGRGENPKKIFSHTQLPSVLKSKGYLTIIPELPYSLFADETVRKQVDQIISRYFDDTKKSIPDLSVGGFSAGGSVALSYAEYRLSLNSSTHLQNVFVIDSPIDLTRLYASSERLIKYNCRDLIYKDGIRTVSYLNQALGGSPNDFPESYSTLSPFSANQANGGNAVWLKTIPLRLYTEPDIGFVKKEYCQELSLEDLNVLDLERLNQFLTKSGNKRVELIITKGRGYHTWNIIDPLELANWIINAKRSP